MPLGSAAAVLAPMLRDRLHRRRQGSLVKSLHRARLAVAAGALCDAESHAVEVDDERACPHCHLRLGGKVFVVLQPSMLPEGGGGSGVGSSGGMAAAGGVGAGDLAALGAVGAAAAAAAAAQPVKKQQQQQVPVQGEEEAEPLRPPGDDRLAAAARQLPSTSDGSSPIEEPVEAAGAGDAHKPAKEQSIQGDA